MGSSRAVSARAAPAILLAGLLLACASGRLSAGPYLDDFEGACRPTVDRALADLGIGAQDIRFLEIRPIVQQRRQRPLVVGVQGWIGLRACPGSLVVDMSRTCQIRNVYGKDGCEGHFSLEGE